MTPSLRLRDYILGHAFGGDRCTHMDDAGNMDDAGIMDDAARNDEFEPAALHASRAIKGSRNGLAGFICIPWETWLKPVACMEAPAPHRG